jgi:hypothetical protein
MSIFNTWQSGTAALMALAITTGATVPLVTTTPASAQLFPRQSSQLAIPSGTSIPVRYEQAEKIVVSPKETMPLTLTVAANIVNRSGRVLIPSGSQVIGQLQPANGGSQFVAKELAIYQDSRQSIDATSRVINQTQVRRGANTGNILKGALAGAAAAAALEGLTGNRKIGVGDILIGTGVGAAGGAVLGRTKADVVVINPDTDLDLTLRSSLALR